MSTDRLLEPVGIGVAQTVRMSNYQYGALLGFVAMAFVVWKWGQSKSVAIAERERGEVIFSNTPQPSEP